MKYKKIYIEITNICNLKCTFCKPCKRNLKFMKIDDFKIIIKKILPYTNYIYLHILGEPLLHKDLDKILDICCENNIKVNITTNGTMIDKVGDMLDNKKSIRQINFSLHSYDLNKNIKKSYLENIITFTKKAKNNIFIVYRFWNLDIINNTRKNIIEKILKEFNYNLKIEEKVLKGNGIKISENLYIQQNKSFVWPKIEGEKIFLKGNCYALKDHIGILVDGTVVPCCLDADGYNKLGNIFEESLDNIINSKNAKKIRKGFLENKVVNEYCQTCGFIKLRKNINT